ncbi:dirigent protein 19-like, partial [Punica granatum]|uniref:Dirigent protein n=1 Tax=Punica granatum TaxID=22663 RepID=A0A6P8EGM5_PUNGR
KLFWHNIVSGKNPSSIEVIRSPIKNSSLFLGFGLVHMFGNRLTISGDINSRLLGRAQGFYSQTGQDEMALLMAQNFAFLEGKYNGSTITVLGRNPILNAIRELPIVGVSGIFRFARGYVQLRTHNFDLNTLDATVEYKVYVLHYD